MSAQKAFELCPEAVFISPRMSHYKTVSLQIRGIFARYTDLIEPLSLDEAYLDVTKNEESFQCNTDRQKNPERNLAGIWFDLFGRGFLPGKFIAKNRLGLPETGRYDCNRTDRCSRLFTGTAYRSFMASARKTVEKMEAVGHPFRRICIFSIKVI